MRAPPMIHTSSYFADSKCANRSGMEENQCSIFVLLLLLLPLWDERIKLARRFNGRMGMLSHVVRPIITALFPAPVVRWTKWAMSALQCGQGRPPLYPMPPPEHMAAINLNLSAIAMKIKCNITYINYIIINIKRCLQNVRGGMMMKN